MLCSRLSYVMEENSMAKIIVNATHKGGEGKTTNSIMLAEYSALLWA